MLPCCPAKLSAPVSRLDPDSSAFDDTYQDTLDRITDEKIHEEVSQFERLVGLTRSFEQSAQQYARVIIGERHLPPSRKTIKPVRLHGVAGGQKFLVGSILFRFAVADAQPVRIYPDDAAAAKEAGHQLRSLVRAVRASHEVSGSPAKRAIRLPLMTLVDWLGYRMVAVSRLPINGDDTLVYGSADGFETFRDCDARATAARAVSVPAGAAPPSVPDQCHVAFGPVDLEVHRSANGHAYVVDFARLFPPEPLRPGGRPAEALTRLLRPELVRWWSTHRQPLCSDSNMLFQWHGSREHQLRVRQAVAFRDSRIIPSLCRYLDRHCSTAAAPGSSAAIGPRQSQRAVAPDATGWRRRAETARGSGRLVSGPAPSGRTSPAVSVASDDDELVQQLTAGDASLRRSPPDLASPSLPDLRPPSSLGGFVTPVTAASPQQPGPSSQRPLPDAGSRSPASSTSSEGSEDNLDALLLATPSAAVARQSSTATSLAASSAGLDAPSGGLRWQRTVASSAAPTDAAESAAPADASLANPSDGFYADPTLPRYQFPSSTGPARAAADPRSPPTPCWALTCGCNACGDGTAALGHSSALVLGPDMIAAVDEQAAAACLQAADASLDLNGPSIFSAAFSGRHAATTVAGRAAVSHKEASQAAAEEFDADGLCRLLHSQGVNLRWLGRVWAGCECDVPRLRIGVECLARTMRTRLRSRWRRVEARREHGLGLCGDHEPWRSAARRALNEACGVGARSALAWVMLLRTATRKFEGLIEGGFVGPALRAALEADPAAVADQLGQTLESVGAEEEADLPPAGAPGRAAQVQAQAQAQGRVTPSPARQAYLEALGSASAAPTHSLRPQLPPLPDAADWLADLRALRERIPPGALALRAAHLCGVKLSSDVRDAIASSGARLFMAAEPFSDADIDDLLPRMKSTPMRHYAEGTLQLMRSLHEAEEAKRRSREEQMAALPPPQQQSPASGAGSSQAASAGGAASLPAEAAASHGAGPRHPGVLPRAGALPAATSVSRSAANGPGKGAVPRSGPAPAAAAAPPASSPYPIEANDPAFPDGIHPHMGASHVRQALSAALSFETALALGGDDAATLCNYGYLLETVLGAPRLALHVYAHGQETSPTHSRARYYLAMCLDKASRRLRKDNQSKCVAPNRRQWLHLQGGIGLRHAVELDPRLANARKDLANFLRHTGPKLRSDDATRRWLAAEQQFRRVLAVDASHSMAWLNLGQLLLALREDWVKRSRAMARAAAAREASRLLPGRQPPSSSRGDHSGRASDASSAGSGSRSSNRGRESPPRPWGRSSAEATTAELHNAMLAVRRGTELGLFPASGACALSEKEDGEIVRFGIAGVALACMMRGARSSSMAGRYLIITAHPLVRAVTGTIASYARQRQNALKRDKQRGSDRVAAQMAVQQGWDDLPPQHLLDRIVWQCLDLIAQRVLHIVGNSGQDGKLSDHLIIKPAHGTSLGYGGAERAGRFNRKGAVPGSAESLSPDMVNLCTAELLKPRTDVEPQVLMRVAEAAEHVWAPQGRQSLFVRCQVTQLTEGSAAVATLLYDRSGRTRTRAVLESLQAVKDELSVAQLSNSMLHDCLEGTAPRTHGVQGAWADGPPCAQEAVYPPFFVVDESGTVTRTADAHERLAEPAWLAKLVATVQSLGRQTVGASRLDRAKVMWVMEALARAAAASIGIHNAFITDWDWAQVRIRLGEAPQPVASQSLRRVIFYTLAAWWCQPSWHWEAVWKALLLARVDVRRLIRPLSLSET
ncbi:hypothetical protein FNF27_03204 [Cafeteria roenbergensis]|uniref:Clu domain-containing protein n=2 Tax=Cafeteria roenbergensis TaxID=33653 RepID=A0A5A8EBI5_CAFRO|nr:hypothetical protein FNF27_03204 [Cafeteria roenbergensis]